MKTSDLNFDFPESLIATFPQEKSRVLWVNPGSLDPVELTMDELIAKIPAGDILVVNSTEVMSRRVFSLDGIEILFLKLLNNFDLAVDGRHLVGGSLLNKVSEAKGLWQVLFPSKKMKLGEKMSLPGGVEAHFVKKGRPQWITTNTSLDKKYFDKYGEIPIPPYIQKARGDRHNSQSEKKDYSSVWSEIQSDSEQGSLAAPTASLHFKETHLAQLEQQGVIVLKIKLHVGLGTFLPVVVDDLDLHEMHSEYVEVSHEVWGKLKAAKADGRNIWGLGTTVVRALESVALGLIDVSYDGGYFGETKLLIQPGFEFKVVTRLLTNFHQPQSTLLALVAGFSGLERVKASYEYAIKNKFRLFSYGDLSAWWPKALLEGSERND